MLREARAAAALEHPNVISIYDVGEVHEPEALRGTAFLAMELVKRSSLRVFERDRSIPYAERLRWLIDVAKALGAAHAHGLVHRDVKPENVMIRQDGVVKVLDFGIAKRSYASVDPAQSTESRLLPMPTLTTGNMAMGTPYYMAPEQMRGDALLEVPAAGGCAAQPPQAACFSPESERRGVECGVGGCFGQGCSWTAGSCRARER